MQETALREGQQPCDGLTLRGGRVDIAAAAQPDTRCTKGGAEGLMPPTTPETSHTFVEHAGGEAAVDAGVVPQLGARAEDARAEDKVGEHLIKSHDEIDCDEDCRKADEASVNKQDGWWKGGEIGWECPGYDGGDLFGKFRAEDEVRVFHHDNGKEVQRKVLDEHRHGFDAEPLTASFVTAKTLACTKRDRREVDCRARQRLFSFGKARKYRDTPVPA